MVGIWSTSSCNERLRELDLVTLKEIGFGELKSNSPILMRRLSKRWSQTLHSSARWEDKRQWAQAKAREAQTGRKKKLSHHTDSQGLDEAVQKGYIVSVLTRWPAEAPFSLNFPIYFLLLPLVIIRPLSFWEGKSCETWMDTENFDTKS